MQIQGTIAIHEERTYLPEFRSIRQLNSIAFVCGAWVDLRAGRAFRVLDRHRPICFYDDTAMTLKIVFGFWLDAFEDERACKPGLSRCRMLWHVCTQSILLLRSVDLPSTLVVV